MWKRGMLSLHYESLASAVVQLGMVGGNLQGDDVRVYFLEDV